MRLKLMLFSLIVSFLIASCNKDEDISMELNAQLTFSNDSLLFDTVFTSIGSSSRRLKISNPNDGAINISNVKLIGGNSSAFSLNINGQAMSEVNNLKINGKDSINVFVKVNINPTAVSLPFIVQDSITFFFNGKQQSIPLVAYGQNANFVNAQNISINTIWDSKLPYIIYNSLTIEENANLTIAPGTKVLFHGNGTMSIKGTLTAVGRKSDSIIFASDRLEKSYTNESGQWNGLHFYPESKDSQMHYTIVKNGVAGITVDGIANTKKPKLLLTNSIVKNMEVVGFLGYQTDVTAFNNLFYNCGQYLFYGVGGGSYNLKQNTFAGYNPSFNRKTGAVYFSDFISSTQFGNLNLDFYNNVVYGNLDNEFMVDKKMMTTLITQVVKNNLMKTTNISYNKDGNILNINPMFMEEEKYNFKLTKTSVANNKGSNLSTDDNFNSFLNKDLQNNKRIFPSDLGCYETN